MTAAYDTTNPASLYPSMNAGAIIYDIFGIAANYYIDRNPLFARLPKEPVGAQVFYCTNEAPRPRTFTLPSGIADASTTSVVVSDSSMFLEGDIIEVEDEFMLITDPDAAANTVTVVRGYASTTAAAHATDGQVAHLVGNSRRGNDVDQPAISRLPVLTKQHVQIFQHPYSVGGALESTKNYRSAFRSPLDRDRSYALENLLDDFEDSAYHGRGVDVTSETSRPAMKGLRHLIQTNKVVGPTNAGSYKPVDFQRDTRDKIAKAGGNGDLVLVSGSFLSGLTVWSGPLQRMPDAGQNAVGLNINTFQSPMLPGCSIIYAPLLMDGACVMLSSAEVAMRVKTAPYDKPRGSRGNATEGDFLAELSIELNNEHHHAWVEGVTSFAPAA